MEELWKDIVGYEGLYQVSNLGNVRSLCYRKTKNRIKNLAFRTDGKGYLKVALYKEHKRKEMRVHVLVAKAFIPNPNNLPEVNHLDENKSNCAVSNLQWCTRKENCNYGTFKARIKATNTNNPAYSKKVRCVETGIIYPSIAEVTRCIGINAGEISLCCRGKKQMAGTYHWEWFN